MHEDGLDAGAVGEGPEPLDGESVVTDRFGARAESQRKGLGEAGPQRLGQRRELLGRGLLLVETAPQLVDPIPGFTLEKRRQLVAGGVVARDATE